MIAASRALSWGRRVDSSLLPLNQGRVFVSGWVMMLGMDNTEYMYQGVTVYHLGYLRKHGLLSTEFKELGILPYYPEFDSVVEKYLRESEGVIDSDGELTDAAQELFQRFLSYDECFWGILLLDAYSQEIVLDMDDELVDANLDIAIPDMPRVFFKICVSGNTASVAVRSGDGVSVSQVSSQRGGRHAAAGALLDIFDPHRGFSSPKSLEAVSQSKVKKVFDGEGLDGFFQRKTIAHAEVTRSTASDNVTDDFVAVMFKEGGLACCVGSGTYIDRTKRSWFYPWSSEGLCASLDLLGRAPVRKRIDLA